MYSTLLYFIVVFSLYALYEQPAKPLCTSREVVVFVTAGYLLFWAGSSVVFGRLVSRYTAGRYAAEPFNAVHTRFLNWCTIAAIACFALDVYLLDLPYYFTLVLPRGNFVFALSGVSVFFFFLLILWSTAFPSYRRFCNPEARLSHYLGSQTRLAVSIIVPWLLYTGIMDLLEFLPEPVAVLLKKSPVLYYVVVTVLFIVFALVYPRLLVKLLHCSPLPQGTLRSRLESFCRAARFRFTDIMLWDLFDGKLITAGVLGFMRSARYVLLSPTLLNLLTDEELEAVMAHEIGHVRHRHLWFYAVFVLGYGLVVYVLWAMVLWVVASQEGMLDALLTADGRTTPLASLCAATLSVLVLLAYFRLLFGVFSRHFERQADTYAVKLTGTGAGIASSLEKIAAAGSLSRTAPNWHHFGIQERINYILQCSHDPGLVHRHDRTVRRLVMGYGAALCVVAVFLYGTHDTLLADTQLNLVQKIAEKKVRLDPDNPALHFLLGNIYFEQQRFAEAEEHYRATLELNPNHAEALNNLAWLYATARDERFRNPEEALQLAQRAAELDPQPHVLDTLAESYFINGYYDQAIETIKQALAQEPDDITYYKEQLKKFERSAHSEHTKQLEGDQESGRVAL